MIETLSFPLLHGFLGNESKCVNWPSKEIRNLLLNALIASQLADGNKISIIDPYKTLADYIPKINFLISDKSKESLHKEISNFVLKYFKNREVIEFNEDFVNFQLISKQLIEIVNLQNEVIFDGVTLSRLYELFKESNSVYPKAFLHAQLRRDDYEFSAKEFWLIREIIDKASSQFKSEYRLLDKFNPFNQNIFITENGHFSTSVLLKYISNFQSTTEFLLKRYTEMFSELQESNRKILIESLSKILHEVNLLAFIDPRDLENKKIELLSSLSELQLKSITELEKTNILNEKNAVEVARKLALIIDKTVLSVDEISFQQLKSLNVKSTKHPALEKLEISLDVLVKSINDSQIFKEAIENNSISSLKKFENLQNILMILLSSRDQLMLMGAFYEWKAFLSTVPSKVSKILERLQILHTGDWVGHFESWYFYEIIVKKTPLEVQDINQMINRCSILSEQVENQFETIVENLVNKERLAYFEDLKSNQASLFNKVIKDKADYTKTDFIGIEDIFFPIDYYGNYLGENTYSGGHAIIVVDIDDSKIDKNKDSHIYVINPNQQTDKLSYSILHRSQVKDKLSDLPLNSKLEAAKFLANFLLLQSNAVNCYLSTNSNIIMQCSPWIQQKVEEIWNVKHLKKVRIDKHPEHAITEFFLNESRHCVYIYDQIYIDKTLSLDASLQCISALQNAGYQSIFIDKIRLSNEEDYLYDLMRQLPEHL